MAVTLGTAMGKPENVRQFSSLRGRVVPALPGGCVGIVVAWLGRLRPGSIVVISVLLGGLMVGGDQVQIAMHVPSAISLALEGAILFCVLGGQIFQDYTLQIE